MKMSSFQNNIHYLFDLPLYFITSPLLFFFFLEEIVSGEEIEVSFYQPDHFGKVWHKGRLLADKATIIGELNTPQWE